MSETVTAVSRSPGKQRPTASWPLCGACRHWVAAPRRAEGSALRGRARGRACALRLGRHGCALLRIVPPHRLHGPPASVQRGASPAAAGGGGPAAGGDSGGAGSGGRWGCGRAALRPSGTRWSRVVPVLRARRAAGRAARRAGAAASRADAAFGRVRGQERGGLMLP